MPTVGSLLSNIEKIFVKILDKRIKMLYMYEEYNIVVCAC